MLILSINFPGKYSPIEGTKGYVYLLQHVKLFCVILFLKLIKPGAEMKSALLFAIACLFILSSCEKADKTKGSKEPAKQIVGTWVWAEQSSITPAGEVVIRDFGTTMGLPVEGQVSTKVVFNSDGTAQNIVEFKPKVNTGKWKIVKDSIRVVWADGRTQTGSYKLIDDTMYIKFGNGNTTIKFVKKS